MIFSDVTITGHMGALSIESHPADVLFQKRASHGLVLYTAGECPYVYENVRFTAQAGQFIYLPQGLAYEIHPTSPSSCLLINFRTDAPLGIPPFAKKIRNFTQMQYIFRSAIRAYGTKKPGSDAAIIADAYRVLSELQASEEDDYTPSGKSQRIQRAMEILETRATDPTVTVAYLAGECRVSEKYFTMLFRAVNGCTPKKYLMQAKVEKAQAMLAYGNAPIGEIAECCGFRNSYYFARCFRLVVGCTPSEYRNIYIR